MPYTKIGTAITNLTKKTLEYYLSNIKTKTSLTYTNLCFKDTLLSDFNELFKTAKSKNIKIRARHLIISFKPSDVIASQALEVSKEIIDKLIGKDWQYFISTHTDKAHIHCHVIINNINYKTKKAFTCDRKFFYNFRNITNYIAKKYGIHTIEINEKEDELKYKRHQKQYKEHYNKYKKEKTREEEYNNNAKTESNKDKNSYNNTKENKYNKEKYSNRYSKYYKFREDNNIISARNKLKQAIDEAIKKTYNFDDFIAYMESLGYECKYSKGEHIVKHLAFKDINQEKISNKKTRFIRSRSLGEEYTEEYIRKRLSREEYKSMYNDYNYVKKNKNKYIDISIAKGNRNYENWIINQNTTTIVDMLNKTHKYKLSSISQLKNLIISKEQELGKIRIEIEKLQQDIEYISNNKSELKDNINIIKMRKKLKTLEESLDNLVDEIVELESMRDTLVTIFEKNQEK